LPQRLDTEALKARFQDKPELLEKLYHEFSRHIDGALPEMRAAFEIGDLKRLEDMAHSLKGNAALIGAALVSELALGVQQASGAGDTEVLASSLPELFNEAQASLEELKRFVMDLA